MANYPEELAQDAVCQSHTGHMTGLWFCQARPSRLNTNELMCVELVIQHAKHICCIMSSVACPAISQFSSYLINGMIFGRKLLNTKCVLGFSIQFSPETFLSLRIIARDININVHKSSREVPVIIVRFQ